jgi:RNA recognition motif-containing protein
MCGCACEIHTSQFTNFDPWDQESFNSRLKAEGDEDSTNLYISNLPKSVTETELSAIFVNYTILSAKILRDSLGNSRGVGFAR